MIQVQELYDSYKRYKGDIADVEPGIFIEWCDFIFKFLYEHLKEEDPERVVQEYAFNVITNNQKILLPTDFMDLKQTSCGIYHLNKGYLFYTLETSPFVVGDKVIGDASGAIGVVDSLGTDYLVLKQVSKNFIAGELVQEESLASGSATVLAPIDFEISINKELDEIQFGETRSGYMLTGNRIQFNNFVNQNLVMRYIPQPPNLTNMSDCFTLDKAATGNVLVEDRHKELLLKAIDLYYAQWDEDMSMEGVADARFTRVLYNILDSYKRTVKVFSFENPNSSF